jgi:hypothetical protein
MRAGQIHPATVAGSYHLITPCPELNNDSWASGRHAVLNSPGHAKSCYPYPFGRRRRRR